MKVRQKLEQRRSLQEKQRKRLQQMKDERLKRKSGYKKKKEWSPAKLTPKQLELVKHPASVIGYGGSAGGGKFQPAPGLGLAMQKQGMGDCTIPEISSMIRSGQIDVDLSMDSKILDWKGEWIAMSCIQVGDRIINPDGQAQEVLQVHEQGIKPYYRVTFEDNTSALCGKEHLWGFWEARKNTRRKTKLKGSREIYSNLNPEGWNKNYVVTARVRDTEYLAEAVNKGRRILVPINAPLNFTHISKAISERAYVYGAMLGDGSFQHRALYSHPKDRFILDEVERICQQDLAIKKVINREFMECCLKKVKWFNCWLGDNKMAKCTSKDKHLPSGFHKMPIAYRYNLAQGLFDTDGYAADPKREVSYTTISKQLAEDVAVLVRTLGYMAKIATKKNTFYTMPDGEKRKGQTAYTVQVQGNHLELLFRLPRKRERAEKMGQFNNGVSWPGKRIVSIEEEGEEYSRCITVSNPNGLYVTDGYNTTHNSYGLIALANYHRISRIFRRTYPNLKDIILKSWDQYGHADGASFNGNEKEWKNLPGDRTLRFGHLDHSNDRYKYQGMDEDLKAFDEATDLMRESVSYVMKWNRSTHPGQHCRTVLTFNPPDSREGLWVVNFFAPWIHPHYEKIFPGKKRAKYGETRWFTVDIDTNGQEVDVEVDDDFIDLYIQLSDGTDEDIKIDVPDFKWYTLQDLREYGLDNSTLKRVIRYFQEKDADFASAKFAPRAYETTILKKSKYALPSGEYQLKEETVVPLSRTFIFANLKDNPYLSKTNYEDILNSFPEPKRSMFKEGIFYVDFESTGAFQVIPAQWVKAAMHRWRQFTRQRIQFVGVDIARTGNDATIFAPRCKAWIDNLVIIPGSLMASKADVIPGKAIAKQLVELYTEDDVKFLVDETGVGSSPVDFLRDMNKKVYAINFGSKAVNGDKKLLVSMNGRFIFKNKVTFLYWHMRELLDPENGYPIMLPDDDELLAELTAHHWRVTDRYSDEGYKEIAIDSKDDVKDRIGRSPDRADAVVLAFGEDLCTELPFRWRDKL